MTTPLHGTQFSRWLDLNCYLQADGSVRATLTLHEAQEGPPGYGHGGISTALLDEAMGMAIWASGKKVLAVNLNINFKQPLPLGVEVTVIGRLDRVEGRKAFASGEIYLPDGTVAVEGQSVFVEAPSHIVNRHFNFD